MTSVPNHDDIWSQAIQEAYASAPTGEVILHSLELSHSGFTDGPVRVVMDTGEWYTIEGIEYRGLYMTLEDDDPIAPSSSVFFQSCMFDLKLPEQRDGALPSIEIQLDNVSAEIMSQLDSAIGSRSPLAVVYREYLASDLTSPQFTMRGLKIGKVVANNFRIIGTAQFSDLINRSFPSKVYRPEEFRGLRQ